MEPLNSWSVHRRGAYNVVVDKNRTVVFQGTRSACVNYIRALVAAQDRALGRAGSSST